MRAVYFLIVMKIGITDYVVMVCDVLGKVIQRNDVLTQYSVRMYSNQLLLECYYNSPGVDRRKGAYELSL